MALSLEPDEHPDNHNMEATYMPARLTAVKETVIVRHVMDIIVEYLGRNTGTSSRLSTKHAECYLPEIHARMRHMCPDDISRNKDKGRFVLAPWRGNVGGVRT